MKPVKRIVYHEGCFVCGGVSYGYTRYELDDGFVPAKPKLPVVFLHGFGQSVQSWNEVARLLLDAEADAGADVVDANDLAKFAWGLRENAAEGFDMGAVYALDFVGHGISACPEVEEPYSMDAVCEAARAFVAWVAKREAVQPVLVGYSMGGRIALECLVRYGPGPGHLAKNDSSSRFARPLSGRFGGGKEGKHPFALEVRARATAKPASSFPIAALVLESAGLGPCDEAARADFAKRNGEWAKQVRDQGVAKFMECWAGLALFESQRSLPQEKQEGQRAARLANDAKALARTFEGTGAHRQSLEQASLAALEAAAEGSLPVLYVAGALDAKYVACARKVAEVGNAGRASNTSNARGGARVSRTGCCCVSIVEGAGHNVHLEQPEEFVRILKGFVARTVMSR